jgi:hypothetical protein
LDKLTTEDYILLSKFYNKNELVGVRPEQLAHLADLGIVEGTSLSEIYLRGASTQDGTQVRTQDKQDERQKSLLGFCFIPRTREEMQQHYGIATREYFRKKVLKPLLESGQLKMTIPDKPNSRNQKYVRA